MTIKINKDNDENSSKSKDNILQIMDGIIAQLNSTKKMFIIMILTIMIIPPIAFAVTFALLGSPFQFDAGGGGGPPEKFGPFPQIAIARIVPILVSLVWLGIGIRQWFVLSKWSKKLQKRIDEKLNDDTDNGGKKG